MQIQLPTIVPGLNRVYILCVIDDDVQVCAIMRCESVRVPPLSSVLWGTRPSEGCKRRIRDIQGRSFLQAV